ncbi:DoxX family protein [Streptomyces sp. NPDC059176]|uniref:DoxX family protein n=1 Tax=unclassified Streptomyces TaxID=2593676 RepID=UPI003696AD75
MSVDTRTPRPGFDEHPALSTVKVNCDPAQVIVNHASFRVKLAPSPSPHTAWAMADTARIPAFSGARVATRRRAPVVWSGKSAPGDPGATGLLQAVRNSGSVRHTGGYDGVGYAGGGLDTGGYGGHHGGAGAVRQDAGATQVIPHIDLTPDTPDTLPTPVVSRRRPPLLPQMRQAEGAYDAYEPYGREAEEATDFTPGGRIGGRAGARAARASAVSGNPSAGVRHAYYPGRRMNLGVVLLPLRVFLGLISVYAGMGKLCDPVYFDGGERGSMVKWLTKLDPWAIAEPLRDFAVSHPVGAGLTVAFLEVVVGVLTCLGLWQRVAAVVGALLSAALIMTVSWRTVPVYDAPDIMNLAAWSPLIIAGAPVYSVDARLAGEAWRKLGPRSELWELRRRVLRRGGIMAAVVVGLTLLIGSVLGAAVRSTDLVTVPGPDVAPTNNLPGAPLPSESGGRSAYREHQRRADPSESGSSSPSATRTGPSEKPGGSERVGGAGTPSESRGTGQQPRRQEPANPPTDSSGPSSNGGSDGGAWGGGTSGGGRTGGAGDGGSNSSGGGSGSSGGGNRNPIGGLLG